MQHDFSNKETPLFLYSLLAQLDRASAFN